MNFNPRPPRGGRPALKAAMPAAQKFQSTPSARRATKQPVFSNNRRIISIHALREEGDGILYSPNEARLHISIHALREEGDPNFCLISSGSWSFQSTPSARRATCYSTAGSKNPTNFNPRPPRGGRRKRLLLLFCLQDFNPRPPRGGRQPWHRSIFTSPKFQSTPSARRATHGCCSTMVSVDNFNPRPPRGGRLTDLDILFNAPIFQSTPSARRATPPFKASSQTYFNFNPRPPRGGRL